MEFTGFPVAALDFYDDLEVDNTKSFWDKHKHVYEAPPGQSFLEAPRCGDAALVVTALSEGGDEQVMAALE